MAAEVRVDVHRELEPLQAKQQRPVPLSSALSDFEDGGLKGAGVGGGAAPTDAAQILANWEAEAFMMMSGMVVSRYLRA